MNLLTKKEIGIILSLFFDYIVPVVGVEPTLLTEHDFESCASANSATPANYYGGGNRIRTGE